MMLLIGFPLLVAFILWYKFSYITIGQNGIHMHKGWLNVTDKQVPYEKVNTVESQQSIIDRLFGCGSLKIFTGNDIQGIVFAGIDKPQQVKAMIEERISLASKNTSAQSSAPQSSPADELIKYANLKERGVISQEEFDAKKNQLLS
ncbi:MAG: PH domain-containing protein [Microcoleus sp.]